MRPAVLLTLVLAFLLPAATAGASPNQVVRDCTDNGTIDSYHSQADYQGALAHMPSDVAEYTECRGIIEAAKRRDASRPDPGTSGGSGGGGGGGGTGGSIGGSFNTGTPAPANNVPTSPPEAGAIAAAGAHTAPVVVAGEPITPGGSGITEAAFRHALPAPLLVVVILFGLAALAVLASGARRRGVRPPDAVLRVFDRVFPQRA
jgi:hypothetical protein